MKYIRKFEEVETDTYYVHPAHEYNIFDVIKKFIDNNIKFKVRKTTENRYYIIFNWYDKYSMNIANLSYGINAEDIDLYGKELTTDELDMLLVSNKYNL